MPAYDPDGLTNEPLHLSAMFERGLDPTERARMGAYFTCREDILLLVEPVLMYPLRRYWQTIQTEAQAASQSHHTKKLLTLRALMLQRIRSQTVLDPACGSGNFLTVALESLLNLEQTVIQHPLWHDLPAETIHVHPRQMLGIEKNPTAQALAEQILWLGYSHWREAHGYAEPSSVAKYNANDQPESPATIQLKDAICGIMADGSCYHPDWPPATVILSNPPFLGSRKLRPELGSAYVDDLKILFSPAFGTSVPDLVCYFFERARQQLEQGRVQRVGLLATNSIRGGTNRQVLERIVQTGQIFLAYADQSWLQHDARVSVSVIGFDNGQEKTITLDGQTVSHINADLSTGADLTQAQYLPENRRIAFQGIIKRGAFDLPEAEARSILEHDPANADVIRPIWNGKDIMHHPRHKWVIDFGPEATLEQAQRYALPFAYVQQHVQPVRAQTNQPQSRDHWWLHWNPRPKMRRTLATLPRYLATPAIAKHRVFVWLDSRIHPDHALIVFARADDYFFGVLNSSIHQLWALRRGTSLENRPRYTPTTVFETFPFPWQPTGEDVNHPAYHAICEAARQLDHARETWKNQPERSSKHTLTKLYNALQVVRGEVISSKTTPDALAFAPQIDTLHGQLDRAVCAAYGWPLDILADDNAILEHLLALNVKRASSTH